MAFTIKRGTNISNWLSQSDRRGPDRERWFTRDDVNRIAEWGFDHIRLPFDEVQFWSEDEKREPEAWHLMECALDWCQAADLRVVADFHHLRSHALTHDGTPALFTDQDQFDRFLALWVDLSKELQSWSTDFLAYEILTESAAKDPADWNRVSGDAFRLLRDREPSRTLALGLNGFNSASSDNLLEIPNDRFCLLTFQVCDPKAVNYDRNRMLADLQPPLRRSRESGLPLYCGGFGIREETPIDVRDHWYRETISIFAEHGIAWANRDYKGTFGLVLTDGTETGVRSLLIHD